MRIISDNAAIYLHTLADTIGKDPISLEHWCCLHLFHREGIAFSWYEAALKKLKEHHRNVECDLIHCPDNDVLLVSRNLQAYQFYELIHELLPNHSNPDGNVMFYDLLRDWRTIRELLLAKAGAPARAPAPAGYVPFTEMNSLENVLAEAKKARNERSPAHILVVDDDPVTRRMVTNCFKGKYAFITASGAREAVASYMLNAPDVVFLDINLPDGSGFDVLHQIIEKDPDAYIVMLSGNSYIDNVTSAVCSGAAGFIAKPFNREKMHHYIIDGTLHHRSKAAL